MCSEIRHCPKRQNLKVMKAPFLKYLVVLLVFFVSKNVVATEQFGDLLIVDSDTSWIQSNPLETYLENKGARTMGDIELQGVCTALWRGYVATWRLENDSLFLIRIQSDYCSEIPTEVDIYSEFKSNRVFANWVNSTIAKPDGQIISSMGYRSIYEGETYYSFENGIVTDEKKKSYLIRDDGLIFPGGRFLHDTIRTMILRSLPIEERADFHESSSCTIIITFDSVGGVAGIRLSDPRVPENSMQKKLVFKTEEVLKDFPRLMKVEHQYYRPPSISIWFSGHCLKYPFDREYGCNYE